MQRDGTVRGVNGSVDVIDDPKTGTAAARRITIGTSHKIHLANGAPAIGESYFLFYAVGDATVDCTGAGAANTTGFIEPGCGDVIDAGDGGYVSVYAAVDFPVVHGEVI